MSGHDLKLDYLKQKPQTQSERLRADLDQLEILASSLRHIEVGEAGQIPVLLDQVNENLLRLQASGLELKGEQAQWETINSVLQDGAANFLRILGGRDALQPLQDEG